MAELISDGSLVSWILALVALEALLLYLYRRGTGHGPRLRDIAPNLAAGAALLLALRSALTGQSWNWIAAWLCVALVAHVGDLAARWRR